MNLALFVVVFITGITFLAAAMAIAGLISRDHLILRKGEAYECGIPTRGTSGRQSKAGYYLFAILFLMFDVETVFCFPGQ